jgi:hypothetical protein
MTIFSDIPLGWMIPAIVVAFGGSYFYYRYLKSTGDFSKRLKFALTILRGLSLSIIILLLLGLVLQRNEYRDEKPIILTLIDDSQSMLNYSDSSTILPTLQKYTDELAARFGENAELVFVDLEMSGIETDSLRFQRGSTNIDEALRGISEQYGNRNLGALVMLSDGNYNRGKNPVYSVDKLGFVPVYTLGVGDTIQKKDLVLTNVLFNDIAFLGNKFPLAVTVEAFEAPSTALKVEVLDKGKVLAEKNFTTSVEGYSLFQETFTLDADRIGFKELIVRVVPIEGESNYQNNQRSIFIEVIDSRSKILLLSAAPHPDLGAIKNTLVRDQNLEVIAKRLTDLGNSGLKGYDLIIWHEPGVDFNPRLMEEIAKEKTPVWFILGPRTPPQTLAKLPLGMEARVGRQLDEVQGSLNSAFSLFELSKESKELVERFPPLTINFGAIALNKSNDVLFYQRVGPVMKKDPLFFFVQDNSVKYGVTYGEGLWRWRLNNFARTQDHAVFNEIVQKTTQYLLLRANTSQLRVNLPKEFLEGEKVIFGASFYNESLEPITTVDISLKLRNAEGEEFDFNFVPDGKAYTLDAGELPAGAYEWFAATQFEGKKFQKQGGFVVRSLAIESLDTRSNFALLNQLSMNTYASFHQLKDYTQLLNELEAREDLVTVSYASTGYKKLIDYKWWFFLLIVLLTTEWFIRRYNGAY